MLKIRLAPLLLSSLVFSLALPMGGVPAQADDQAELNDALRVYERRCSTAKRREAFAQELKSKNEILSEKGVTTSWAGNFGRAAARIECGNWRAKGDALFRCQADTQCTKGATKITELRKKLPAQAEAPAPRQAQRTDDIPAPEVPLPTQSVAETVITVSTPRTGQRPITHPSDANCGIPSTIEIRGNKAHAVLNYRRNRMYKQVAYDLCVSHAVSDQDRQGCASVVKPMAMSDITANGSYLRSHAEARELFACLKQTVEKNPDLTHALLAQAEATCLGTSHPDALQSSYLADLPDCQLAHAVRDTASAPTKDAASPGTSRDALEDASKERPSAAAH